MRSKMLPFLLTVQLGSLTVIAQNSWTHYQHGQAMLAKKEYAAAAAHFGSAMRAEIGVTTFRGNLAVYTASLWAKVGETDSAFAYLTLSSGLPNTVQYDVYLAENNPYFNALRKDRRWAPAMTKLKARAAANSYPQKEIIYGHKDGMALTMVQISPKLRSNKRAIIYVVSGSWYSSYNGVEANAFIVKQYLDKGYTVFSVMHGSNPRFAIPDAIADLKRSVRYIRYHARELGIDPGKIGITGGSAGGHLSLCVALDNDSINTEALDPVDRVSSRVQAAAVLYPPTDVMNWGGPGVNMVNMQPLVKTMGGGAALDFKVWNSKFNTYDDITDTATRNQIGKEISPINAVSNDDPPVFIIHGDSDKTVPVQQSKIIVAAWDKAGIRNRLIIKKGGDHNVEDMMPEYLEFVQWFDQWLK